MKKALTISLLFIAIIVKAQEVKTWQVSLQLQPELTIHKNDYSGFYGKPYMKTSLNVGVVAMAHKNFSKNIFAEAGVSYIPRKLNASVFISQAKMFPSPSGLYFDRLNIPQSVSYRILQFPVGIGVNLFKTERATFFAKGTFIPKFLLNTKYGSGHEYVFRNNFWQGFSVNAGLGFDCKLNDKFSFTNVISYPIKNTVKSDYYTFSQTDEEIALTHTFLQISTGIKMNF